MFARTERLLLRPSWPEDAAAIYNGINDEGIVRNLARAPWPYTLEDAESFAALQHDLIYPNFMLMKRTDGAPELIGSCGLGEYDGMAELGYWIARPHWGKGYASEAAKAVIGVAKAIGHKRLLCGHYTDNPASGRVMIKQGFQPVGATEMRYSAGRRESAPCVTMEMSLDESEDSDVPSDLEARMLPSRPQLRAA